jgi:two-component system cell cycle response regulator DivK
MRATILVVEDDDATRAQLVTLLEREGYSVAVTDDGHAALAYLRSQLPPCCVLLKLTMLADDCWQFLAARRSEPKLARVPVIALCAAAEKLRPAALALGAEQFLAKPVNHAALVVTVARYR